MYKEYINKIIEESNERVESGSRIYHITNDHVVRIWTDTDGKYLNGLQYRSKRDFFWTWGKPEDFYNNFLNKDNQFNFIIHSFRKYGQPKLTKPKELKGIKQLLSVEYIPNKSKCQVFVNSNDVWVKHVDYFSPSMKLESDEIGMPLEVIAKKYMNKNRKKKFVYDDAWGSIVLRQEAWIKLENLKLLLQREHKLDVVGTILQKQEEVHKLNKYELTPSEMERFWERMVERLVDIFNK